MSHEVQRSVDLAADPARVWDEIVGGAWLGDEGLIEPRPGADGWIREGTTLRHLVVEEARAGHRLVFRWWPLGPGGVGPATRVRIDVEAAADDAEAAAAAEPERTRVVVTEAPAVVGAPLPSTGPMAMATV